MTICRTCLTTPAEKDILGLEKDINECNRNYLDIMLFCLDIKVIRNSPVTTNLCHNCYGKIISFYKFKEQCLKNDTYLKSLGSESSDHDIKNENCIDSDGCDSKFDEVKIEIKGELDVKQEDTLDLESDDELLSVKQKIKYEYIAEESKENTHVPKKRGRTKKPKSVCKIVKNNARQVCEECGKSVRNLSVHSQRHRPKSERRRVQCKVCPQTFNSNSSRNRHNRVKHLGIKEQCDICKKEVKCLREHKLVVHEQAALRHVCVSCGRRFISQSALDVHMTSHTESYPHECDQCDRKFRAKWNLDLHRRRVHDKEKTHLCQFCSKAFFSKEHLQKHIRSHTKEKPYECVTCGKFFSSTTTLKSHRLIHSEEKPFRCDVCFKTFTRSGSLKNHMIKHTRARPHPCRYCGLRFGHNHHRKRHEFTAHEKHIATK